jgi:EAL domain-containing protein (putative c-di-GMP-specific phosphodiesterase class I)
VAIDDWHRLFLARPPAHHARRQPQGRPLLRAGISHDTSDTALVAATLTLGRVLGMGVVAEGIETEQQASSLRELACPIAHGNLFARPLPAEELDGLLEAGLRL